MPGFVRDLLLIVGLLTAVGVVGRVAEQVTWPRRVARVRRFSMAQYRTIMNRAGWRCEHHGLILGRCKATDNLEADHVQPHARGGQTALENGQALCRFHNSMKGAWVPSLWSIWSLQRRRHDYFPDWADVHVVRFGDWNSEKEVKRRRKRRRRRR
jgi:hypothetical protein